MSIPRDENHGAILIPVFRIGSYTWKASWGPQYHPSMAISLAALVISSLLSLGKSLGMRYSVASAEFCFSYPPDTSPQEQET